MNNYGTATTTTDFNGKTTTVVPEVASKKIPKTTMLQTTPLSTIINVSSSLLLFFVTIPIIILFLFVIPHYTHHANDDAVATRSNNNNNNNNNTSITINYDDARRGPICVSMDGNNSMNSTSLEFVWNENHNFYQMPNEIAYENCDFSNATLLRKVGPNPKGYTIKNIKNTTMTMQYYFSCSKLCASNGHKVRVCVDGISNGQENDDCSAFTTTKHECTAARTYDLRQQQQQPAPAK